MNHAIPTTAAAAALTAALGPAVVPAGAQPVLVNDDFDCYRPGDPVSALPDWEVWQDAVISDEQSFSGSNSLRLLGECFVLHRVGPFVRERVTYRVMTYVPTSSVGLLGAVEPWVGIGEPPPPVMPGHLVAFDTAAGLLELLPDLGHGHTPTTALILDRWVELRAEIDLVAGMAELYYDGVRWTDTYWPRSGHIPIELPHFEAISFVVAELASGPGMYIDDVVVTRPGVTPPSTCGGACYPDCDSTGALDFFDFLCFQNEFAVGSPYADCDGSGAHDFFDFLCFQNAFAAGCP